jgi:hypothetical protein
MLAEKLHELLCTFGYPESKSRVMGIVITGWIIFISHPLFLSNGELAV